jgi:S1-C subfamily serine protease
MTTQPPEESPRQLPEELLNDQPTPSEPTDATDAVAGPSNSVLVDPTPTESTESTASVTSPADPNAPPPWPAAPMPGGPGGPLAPPPTPRRSGSWKQFVAGALVGALVGGATAGGVYAATKDDSSTRTVIVGSNTGTARNTSAIATPRDIQGILAKVEPAVVAIRTGGAVAGSSIQSGGAGTGFVISADGVIVTNNHVVDGAGGQIEVAFTDGTSKQAKVLGKSPENDLAVLKVDAAGLPFAKLGSSEKLQVGDGVIAIGNALALEGGLSVTQGIISAKNRTVPEQTGARLFGVLQTDAAINPGNSGGPLVNSNGEVVGINTAIADPSQAQNVGFAISIDAAKSVIQDLRVGKAVKTAFLGVETEAVTPAIATQLGLTTKRGAVIRRITSNSPASKADLKAQDVIIAVNGNPVTSPDGLAADVRKLAPGDKANVLIERNGNQKAVSVTLGDRPTIAG